MSPLAQALSAALIHFLWQGAIVGLLLWTALVALKTGSANARYVAGCVALATLAVLPVATTAVLYQLALADGVAAGPIDAAVRVVVDGGRAGPNAWMGADLQRTAWLIRLQGWALPIWSLGVVLFSLRLACGGAQAFVLGRRGRAADAPVLAAVAGVATRLGIDRPIRVLISTRIEVPSVMGWLCPVILLPPATAMGLTPQQLEAVLAHELAHVKRHDYLVNIFQMVVETLLFYHPVVWWTSRRMRLERELCCDDLAVSSCGDVLAYARALAALERQRLATPGPAMGSTGGSLLYRIQRLTGVSTRQSGASRWASVIAIGVGLACVGLSVGVVRAQATRPSFEVASIKRNISGASDYEDVFRPGGRYNAINITVRQLIRSAYRLQGFQIVSDSSWFGSDRFDIVAKSASEFSPPRDPDSTFGGLLMLQTLLADRCRLVVHHEARQLPVFALVMARRDGKLGSQLRRPDLDCRDRFNAKTPVDFCGGIRTGLGRFTGHGATMRQLAVNLSPRVGRMVLDRTGLSGGFDLDLEWTPTSAAAPGADPSTNPRGEQPDTGSSIFTALQEQLGLKLDSRRGPVDVLVIDHVERPTED